jgi:hypothetical protein
MACLIRVPTEVVKSRAQIAAYGKDVGTFGAAAKLMQIEGIRGFYRGFGITLARDVSPPQIANLSLLSLYLLRSHSRLSSSRSTRN